MSIWRSRLLDIVKENDGITMADIRRRFVELYGETFAAYDLAIVEGQTHWYRKVLWARNDLAKEGKIVQEGDKIYLAKEKPEPEPKPLMGFGEFVLCHVFILIIVVVLILMGGK